MPKREAEEEEEEPEEEGEADGGGVGLRGYFLVTQPCLQRCWRQKRRVYENGVGTLFQTKGNMAHPSAKAGHEASRLKICGPFDRCIKRARNIL